MLSITIYTLAFLASFITTVISTPIVKKLAIKINAVDKPCERKVHRNLMPRLGGIGIVLGTGLGMFILSPSSPYMGNIIIGGFIITIIGVLDDMYNITAMHKLVGQIIAAIIVVASGLSIDMIHLPFSGYVSFGLWAYPFTIIWIVGITNAMNLIDGLDGLAAGVSSIALMSILTMAVIDSHVVVVALSIVLIGSTLGFLVFNFYPAKIFMGDTGSLFLGYSISVISMLGFFKNITIFSFVIPVIILAIPIFDTLLAIIRRLSRKQKLTTPDKSHLHYCLIEVGLSHRKAVLVIYGMSAFFGLSAIVFSTTTMWAALLIIFLLMLSILNVSKKKQRMFTYLVLRLMGKR